VNSRFQEEEVAGSSCLEERKYRLWNAGVIVGEW